MIDCIDRWLFRLLSAVLGLVFLGMMLAVFAAVILREVFTLPYPWLSGVARFLMIWSVFLGAAMLARSREHITIGIFYEMMPRRMRKLADLVVAAIGIALVSYFSYLSIGFTVTAYQQGQTDISAYLPVWIGYLAMPLGLALVACGYLFSLRDLLRHGRQ